MLETATSFHQLEWPADGARVAGPVVWLRGWVNGKPGFDFVDVRVLCVTGIHLGVLGMPRVDLAVHFKSERSWLPAEFVVGVPLPDGAATLAVEAMDEFGNWHALQSLTLIVEAVGATSLRNDGELQEYAGGSRTIRTPHLPFHGHIDQAVSPLMVRSGCIDLFGWLLHETEVVRTLFATFDGLVFNALESGLNDDSLAAKVPHHSAARHARLRGGVDVPPTLTMPACLRVYAELADGTVHLCFAYRFNLSPEILAELKPSLYPPDDPKRPLPVLPSGRPRRLLFFARTLQPDDATLRALDIVSHLTWSNQWNVRLIASEDGPLRRDFETSNCAVQMVDPRAFFAASQPAAVESSLLSLDREIWWRHLNGVVNFDSANTWAGQLARRHGVPIFQDPTDSIVWFAPTPVFSRDGNGCVVAPIRGQAIQGAGIILHAASQLARHHGTNLENRQIVVTDARDTSEEILFKESLALQTAKNLRTAPSPAAVAAVICPVFAGHPHRALFSALAAGIPVITTPSPLLSATFGPNEVSYVPAGNPLALAHAIADTLANPAAHERRSVAAARIVTARHAPNFQLARWEKLLESTIGS